ncbi:Trehalose utilization [Roseimaritima multifibrata]|uniref:Trehalose utilization n=1 Tax=Roseimaritima multifibrata TaxID=1930274 RepID=A0A517ME38_9BACT|nr:ThuA domain-containing protein [Roseimaritima multifibrata]QDS93096.1 Trehalose utilization [Roseimaritima multifibrata]
MTPCQFLRSALAVGFASLIGIFVLAPQQGEAHDFLLQHQVETAPESGLYHRVERAESWKPSQTAIIVCDMWDSHHCYRAVERATEMAPRMNALLKKAREMGVVIIHAPSDCMDAYQSHPARKRAMSVPAANNFPAEIAEWCYKIPSEELADYPIDQSDGGEDDTPEEHAAWEKVLVARGLNPKAPWTHQMDALEIDSDRDYISDSGTEIWSLLESKGIENVVLTGVHLNMCVLGRPFGLRRMVAGGKNAVVIRDLTDTMYNPAAEPYVNHFSGTDLILDHIERHVCATITSDQILDGEPFQFEDDDRPRLAILIGEGEYETERTLPAYAVSHLGKTYSVDIIHADVDDPNHFPGIERIAKADVLLISVRRRTPPAAEMKVIRDFIQAGKPVVGIRTASHAFLLRNKKPAAGLADWLTWDADVFGGSYTNHYGNELFPEISVVPEAKAHPILDQVRPLPYTSKWSLYRVSPLLPGTTALLNGKIEGKPAEPVAWTFTRADGGRSFYTSLGHKTDFQQPAFQRLLKNGIDWAVEIPVESK